MSLKVIITGATGMVGEGVLHTCLQHPQVESVLVINRRPCSVEHPKLKEIIHADFSNFDAVKAHLGGYNAVYLCMGVSSFRMNEADYSHLTYDLTLALARSLESLNPDMTLCYVSGVGTDSTEKGRSMWGRVKGKTENDLLKLKFRQAFMFRPGFIQPTPGLQHAYNIYKIVNPLVPLLRFLFPRYISSLQEIGLAMIQASLQGYHQPIIEVKDILALAQQQLNNEVHV